MNRHLEDMNKLNNKKIRRDLWSELCIQQISFRRTMMDFWKDLEMVGNNGNYEEKKRVYS